MVKLCSIDLETPQDEPSWGLQPWRARTDGATIKSCAFWEDDSTFGVARMPTKAWFKDFLDEAVATKTVLVTWNGLFELAWLHALGLTKEVNACTWMDAMLLLKRVDGWKNRELGGKGYGLKTEVARRWPEHADYGLGDDVTKVPQTEEEWKRLLDYNLLDAKFTTLLAKEYLEQLSPEEQRAARQEALGLSPVALSAINGINVNMTALDALDKDVAVRRVEAEAKLDVPASVIASPKQLAKLLFDDWGFPVVNTTPKGAPATDKEALLTLELEFPDDHRLRALLDVRKCNTQQAKFVDAVRESVKYHGEPVTRPSPILSGTCSGRLTYGSNQGKGKAQAQTGVAIHQWERGKAARSILEAPEGFIIAEFDASGQEMRLMADASQDEMMLRLFNDGIDGHAYMGAQIEGREWQWVHEMHDKDPEAKRIRNLGKFCIAEGELVLTDRGLVPIEQVQLADRVWDGVEWVTHTGVVFQGEKDVITYQGLTATPEHKVWLKEGGTAELQHATSEGLQIATSEHGGKAIWVLGAFEFNRHSEEEKRLRRMYLHLWCSCAHCLEQLDAWEVTRVPKVCGDRKASSEGARCNEWSSLSASTETMQRYAAAMFESARSELRKLWRSWDQVSIQLSGGGYCVGDTKPAASNISGCRPGQDRQQRTLRSGESSACIQESEFEQYAKECVHGVSREAHSEAACLPCAESALAGCDVHRRSGAKSGVERAEHHSDARQVQDTGKLQTKRTYDITNAGPRHRFTVSGKLVSNCNLSLQYRIGVDTIRVRALTQYGLNITHKKATHLKDTYLKTYPGVPRYWQSAIRLAGKNRYAETRGHRRIAIKNPNIYEQQQTAINFPIQGTGADMKTLAIAVLRTEFNDDVMYAWDLHDALFLYIRDDDRALETVKRIRKKLDELPYQIAWGWTPAIPLPWDASWGKSWGSLKGVEK